MNVTRPMYHHVSGIGQGQEQELTPEQILEHLEQYKAEEAKAGIESAAEASEITELNAQIETLTAENEKLTNALHMAVPEQKKVLAEAPRRQITDLEGQIEELKRQMPDEGESDEGKSDEGESDEDIIRKPLIVGEIVRFLGDETLTPIKATITGINPIYTLWTMDRQIINDVPGSKIEKMYVRGGSKRRRRRRTKQRKLSKKRKSTKKTKRKISKRKKTKRKKSKRKKTKRRRN